MRHQRRLRARGRSRARRARGRARDERRARASRPGRRRLLRRPSRWRSATAGWPSSTAPAATSRWRTKTARCWIVFNGEIYNHRALRPLLEAQGPPVPHRRATPRRSSTPTRSSGRRAWTASKACSRSRSTTAGAASCSPRAIGSARSRSSTPCSDGVFHFASELPALAQLGAVAGRRRPHRARGLPLARLLPRAATIYRDVSQADARPLAARGRTDASRRASTGTSASSTPIAATDRRSARATSTRRCGTAVHDRLESEVPLGAFLSGGIDSGLVVSYMAEALGDRLVTAIGRLRRARRTTSSRPPALTARALRQPPLRGGDRAAPRRGASARSPTASASRWPTRRRSRPGTSRGRRGGTSPWRSAATAATRRSPATTSGTCRTRSRPRARAWMPRGARAGVVGWLGRAVAAVAALPRALRAGHAARESRTRPGRRLLRRPRVPQAADARALMGLRAAIATRRRVRSTTR